MLAPLHHVISGKCSIVLLIFYTLEYAPLCSKDKGQIDDLINFAMLKI